MKNIFKIPFLFLLLACSKEENPDPVKSLFFGTGSLKVNTSQAAGIKATTAILTGTVTSVSSQTSAGFVVSKSNSLPELSGYDTQQIQAINTSKTDSFSVAVNNLNHSTSYYYRAYAQDSKGLVYGAVQSFITYGLGEGSVAFYLKRDFECGAFSLYIDGIYQGQLINYFTSGTPQCFDAYTVSLKLPPGQHLIQYKCGSTDKTNTFTVVANTCTTYSLQ